MGLYERLLQEAAQEEKEREDPEQEEQRRRRTHKRQKMQAYIRSRRKPVPKGGGYLTSEEIKEEQDRYLADLQTLSRLMSGGVRSMGASYRLVYLRSKYPVEYAHLRDIEISSD